MNDILYVRPISPLSNGVYLMSLRPSVAEQSVRDPSGVGPFFAVFDYYIYDDAILNRPCLSERNGKIENGEKRANAARMDRLLCDGRSQRHEVNAIR